MAGINLIPFTIQKQNLVTSMLSSLLAPAEVWQLRCMAVKEASPQLQEGAVNISTAELSYVMQQRTAAGSFVGEVSNEKWFVYLQKGLQKVNIQMLNVQKATAMQSWKRQK